MGTNVQKLGVIARNKTIDARLAPEGATPTLDVLPRRMADFATLGEALDYAARGERGMNFHDARGTLVQAYPYALLREDALGHARRFMALGLEAGDRLALVAETGADFAACFFGAVYAGLWPVPLPLPTSFGGKESYIDQLAVQLQSSDPKMLLYPAEIAAMAGAAAERQGCEGIDWESFATRDAAGCSRNCSASKSRPCGVAITISPSTTHPAGRRGSSASCSSGK